MKKKMGRPTTNPKVHQTRIRMTNDEWEALNFCAKKTGKTKTDIVVEGIKLVKSRLESRPPLGETSE